MFRKPSITCVVICFNHVHNLWFGCIVFILVFGAVTLQILYVCIVLTILNVADLQILLLVFLWFYVVLNKWNLNCKFNFPHTLLRCWFLFDALLKYDPWRLQFLFAWCIFMIAGGVNTFELLLLFKYFQNRFWKLFCSIGLWWKF